MDVLSTPRAVVVPADPPVATAAPRKIGVAHGLLGTILLVIVLRAVVLLAGFVSLHLAPAGTEPRFNYEHPWTAWDARHYYELAAFGYSPDRKIVYEAADNVGRTSFNLIAYFPLVPLAGRLLGSVMPTYIGLIVLSNVCTIAGLIVLYLWARRRHGESVAAICVLLVATFPGAVAFAAGMTEGPFLLLVALALWCLDSRRFWLAALCAGIATAARPTGIALTAVVTIYALMSCPQISWPKRLWWGATLTLVGVSGIVAYEIFLWQRYHTPTAYSHAQEVWTQSEQTRLAKQAASGEHRYSLDFYRSRVLSPQAINRGLAILILAITLIGLVKPPETVPRVLFLLPLLILLMTSLPGHGLRISSIPRYESGAIPLFLLPAIWLAPPQRRTLLLILLVLQFAIQVYYATLFPREIWVG